MFCLATPKSDRMGVAFYSKSILFLVGSLLSKPCVLPVECHFLLDADLILPDCTISTPTGGYMQETIPRCHSISRRMAM